MKKTPGHFLGEKHVIPSLGSFSTDGDLEKKLEMFA